MEVYFFLLMVSREGGHTNLHTEHFKTWLSQAYLVKEAIDLLKSAKWIKLVELVQSMW